MRYIKDFESFLRIDRNHSENTVNSYVSDVNKLMAYVKVDVQEIKPFQVRDFYVSLVKEGRERSSLNRLVVSLRTFFNYLVDNSIITSSPVDLKSTRTDKTLPKPISKSDVQSLISAAARISLKDQILAELLYSTGGRVSEIVSLKVDAIDTEEAFLSLFGKGRKERNNPLHETFISLLKSYMAEYGISDGYLFPHRTIEGKHMTREALGKATKKWANEAGVDPAKVSPHVFRHSFATHMLENGCDMSQVQELLGHENISTTRIYAKITRKSKKENFRKFHPMSQSPVL